MEIVIENYTKRFMRDSVVLDDINYKFVGGKIYGLYGKNGSGKTMLMRAISGLIFPTQGRVIVNGEELRNNRDFPENIGILLENPFFIPHYTGYDNLKLLASIKNIISEEELRDSLISVGLDPTDKKKVKKYSLGMKQRLGIAAAIMEKPDILLLDEPFNAIDENSYDMVRRILRSYRDKGKIVIIACHDMEELNNLSDEIIKISNGKLI